MVEAFVIRDINRNIYTTWQLLTWLLVHRPCGTAGAHYFHTLVHFTVGFLFYCGSRFTAACTRRVDNVSSLPAQTFCTGLNIKHPFVFK